MLEDTNSLDSAHISTVLLLLYSDSANEQLLIKEMFNGLADIQNKSQLYFHP